MKIKVQDAFERALVAPAGAAATDMKGEGALENAQVALDLRPIGGFGMMPCAVDPYVMGTIGKRCLSAVGRCMLCCTGFRVLARIL